MPTNPQIVAFMERAAADPAVKLRLEAVEPGPQHAESITSIGNGLGYDFTPDEFVAYQEGVNALGPVALDDATLDDVSGGLPHIGAF